MGTIPTFEQAQLHLQVYDQRREARLRQARDWFQQNYKAETFDEAMRLAPMGTGKRDFRGNGDGLLGTGLRITQLWAAE
jgi:hypothetical protein